MLVPCRIAASEITNYAIDSRPLATAALISSDDPHQFTRMVFGAADICDREVWRNCEASTSAAKPVCNLAVAVASARGQTCDQNFRRRRYQDDRNVRVSAAHRVNDRTRYIRDDRAVGADILVDRAWQRVAMAMRLPIHRKLALDARQPKGLRAHLLITFVSRGRARHHAARKDQAAVTGAADLREAYQRVLAGAARADHQDEPARSDRAGIHT